MTDDIPISVLIPGSAIDPRDLPAPPDGVTVHYGPPLHPDDLTVIDGIPVTSLARTLIDLAEVVEDDRELRSFFVAARADGLLDRDELIAARGRVEWRPSLERFDRIAAEFI